MEGQGTRRSVKIDYFYHSSLILSNSKALLAQWKQSCFERKWLLWKRGENLSKGLTSNQHMYRLLQYYINAHIDKGIHNNQKYIKNEQAIHWGWEIKSGVPLTFLRSGNYDTEIAIFPKTEGIRTNYHWVCGKWQFTNDNKGQDDKENKKTRIQHTHTQSTTRLGHHEHGIPHLQAEMVKLTSLPYRQLHNRNSRPLRSPHCI